LLVGKNGWGRKPRRELVVRGGIVRGVHTTRREQVGVQVVAVAARPDLIVKVVVGRVFRVREIALRLRHVHIIPLPRALSFDPPAVRHDTRADARGKMRFVCCHVRVYGWLGVDDSHWRAAPG